MQLSKRLQKVVPAFGNNIHPVLQNIFAARGIEKEEQLGLSLADLISPKTMLNIDKAVALLQASLAVQQHILIVADFDADGATSCALAVLCLRQMGFKHVSYLVPNRFEYGYGLTPEIVQLAKQQNPDLIMTVDNGIASNEGIALANSLGISVLVTDHHLAGEVLPDAACILNPNQPGCAFPSKALAGVGVVFYLMAALRTALRSAGWFEKKKIPILNLGDYLDLVALGTVADVVPLDENNRCLVHSGLRLIRSGKARFGIKALLDIAGRDEKSVVASDLGFAAGPRLNAAGRLQDMSLGIECLLSDSEMLAKKMALELDALNKDRKVIEQDMQSEAVELLKNLPMQGEEHLGICLFDPGWHQGVIGILASRIKEKMHRPVIVFADAGLDVSGQAIIKGSARSISGIHIRDILDAVATHNPELLSKFGGHAMAAGLTIAREDFAAFSSAFEQELLQQTDPEVFNQTHWYDGELLSEYFTLDFAMLLRYAAPWGQSFPEPLFSGAFKVVNRRVLADKHLKLVLMVPHSETIVDAIAFNVEPALLQQEHESLQLLYKIDVNEFRGRSSVQLIVENLRPIE